MARTPFLYVGAVEVLVGERVAGPARAGAGRVAALQDAVAVVDQLAVADRVVVELRLRERDERVDRAGRLLGVQLELDVALAGLDESRRTGSSPRRPVGGSLDLLVARRLVVLGVDAVRLAGRRGGGRVDHEVRRLAVASVALSSSLPISWAAPNTPPMTSRTATAEPMIWARLRWAALAARSRSCCCRSFCRARFLSRGVPPPPGLPPLLSSDTRASSSLGVGRALRSDRRTV